MCVVEVEGARVLQASCVAQVSEGMKVHTRTPRVERSRRTILEMLESAVDLSQAPEIQAMQQDYAADLERFPGAEERQVLSRRQPDVRGDYSSACCAGACRCAPRMPSTPRHQLRRKH
jgi:predicted molibdopterin-dependent oxidoreductase YjgC